MTALRVSIVVAASLVLLAAGGCAKGGANDRSTGFLTEKTGGMQADAWSGTSLATAKRLVSGLPAAPRSRALRDLQFEVMVSQLAPPAADGSSPPSLFDRKVDRLAAMGEGESLNEMVRTAGDYGDPAVAAIVTNAMMMAGEQDGACAVADHHALAEPFGRRARIACMLVRGDRDGVAAEVAALRGRDSSFVSLVEVAAGTQAPASLPAPRVEALADGPAMVLYHLAHVVPPSSLLSTTQPPLIRALVGQTALPMATRIEIAERGEALAVIDSTRLADLYVEALSKNATLPPAMEHRARLVAAARKATNPQELADAVRAIYGEMQGSPLFPTIARAGAATLLNLPPKPEYADLAQDAIRGLLLLGDKQRAKAWTQLALQAAFNDTRARNGLDRLMPLIEIAGVDNAPKLAPEDVNRWYDVLRQDDPGAAALRGSLLLVLFRGLGFDIPPGSTNLPENPPSGSRLVMPPAGVLQALQAAGAAHRRAEASLLASNAIGETPLAALHPSALGGIVRALREAGEEGPARLFAVEAAIAYGL